MEIRAEQILVAGVMVIGALAAWQLARPGRQERPQEPTPLPPYPPLPPIIWPDVPPPFSVHGNLVQAPGFATLRPGLPYRGRLELDQDYGGVERFLQAAGFQPIAIYMTAAEADLESALLAADPSPRTRWFYAFWRGGEGTHVQIPTEITAITPTAAPAPARVAGWPAFYTPQPRFSPSPCARFM